MGDQVVVVLVLNAVGPVDGGVVADELGVQGALRINPLVLVGPARGGNRLGEHGAVGRQNLAALVVELERGVARVLRVARQCAGLVELDIAQLEEHHTEEDDEHDAEPPDAPTHLGEPSMPGSEMSVAHVAVVVVVAAVEGVVVVGGGVVVVVPGTTAGLPGGAFVVGVGGGTVVGTVVVGGGCSNSCCAA